MNQKKGEASAEISERKPGMVSVTGDSKEWGVRSWYDGELVRRELCNGLEVREGDRVIIMVVERQLIVVHLTNGTKSEGERSRIGS